MRILNFVHVAKNNNKYIVLEVWRETKTTHGVYTNIDFNHFLSHLKDFNHSIVMTTSPKSSAPPGNVLDT